MDIGPSPVQEEVLVPQLAWRMKNISSMVQGSRMVQVHSQPGTYDPATSRLVKMHLAASNEWADLASLKLCFDIHNKDAANPLEFIVPPLGIFEQYRLLSQGTVLTQIDFLSRAISTLNSTLPLEARVANGEEGIPLRHGMQMKKEPNADGRNLKYDNEAAASGGVYVATAGPIRDSSIEVDRFVTIPPGQKRSVCCTPLCGITNSGMAWPLPAASLVYEFRLVS